MKTKVINIKTLICAALAVLCMTGAQAQTGRVILPTREISIEKAFDEIERQTPYRIEADRSAFNPERTTFLSGNVLTVGDLLRQVLTGTGYTYTVDENRISLTSDRDASSANAPSARPARHWASTSADGESIEIVMINFHVNKTNLVADYMNNRYSLGVLDRTLSDPLLSDDMDYITITAAASPEGYADRNEKLAIGRAETIKSYIVSKHPHIDAGRILTFSVGEDWAGLKKMVEDDPATPGRSEVLALLAGGGDNDLKKIRLKAIENGRAYAYIAKNMLPYLRGGAACMIYYKSNPPVPDTVVLAQEIRYVERMRVDTIFIDRERIVEVPVKPPKPPKPPKDKKPYYLAVKTNLLADAALLPNLAVEFSLPRRWSVEAEGHWSWWNTHNGKHYYHRVQAAGIEIRKWLGDKSKTPFTGHYLGVYGAGGDYDLRFGRTGYLGASKSWSAGVSYGYATPIGRSFNLELGIGVGYFGGEYKKYTYDGVHDRYPWQSDHTRSYFGPTKAKLSLVWLVGSGRNRR